MKLHSFSTLKALGLSLLLLSGYSHAWQSTTIDGFSGITNDFFDIKFVDVSGGAIADGSVSEELFMQSVGNVIDYYASILEPRKSLITEKIQVDFNFSALDENTLGTASQSLYFKPANISGTIDEENKTFQINASDISFETSEGTQFTRITAAQSKLLTGVDLVENAADFTINFNSAADFYFGDISGKSFTDFTDPTYLMYDFESVLTHEIAHGLGTVSQVIKPEEGSKNLSLSTISVNIETDAGLGSYTLIDEFGDEIYATTAWDSLIGADVLNNAQTGDQITLQTGEVSFDVFNPDPWKAGSSLSHIVIEGVLDQDISNLEVYRELSEAELTLFRSLGYSEIIPEPSIATLGLLACAGLLARRRRRPA